MRRRKEWGKLKRDVFGSGKVMMRPERIAAWMAH